MSDQEPRRPHDRDHGPSEVPEGAHPTINQPINAEPRARLAPALLTLVLVAGIVVLILALTML